MIEWNSLHFFHKVVRINKMPIAESVINYKAGWNNELIDK